MAHSACAMHSSIAHNSHAHEVVLGRLRAHNHGAHRCGCAWANACASAGDDFPAGDLAKMLGLKFTDAAINQLSIFGGGSSFDGMKYIKTAWEMDVNTRYKTMEYDKTYQTLLQKYKHVLDIRNEVFGKQI